MLSASLNKTFPSFFYFQCRKYRQQFDSNPSAAFKMKEKLAASELFKSRKEIYPPRCARTVALQNIAIPQLNAVLHL